MTEDYTKKLPAQIGAIAADIVSAIVPSISSTAGIIVQESIGRIFDRRREQAREILLDELSTGSRTVLDAAEMDEFVAILYRYLNAAQVGAARLNLRLLAAVIAGQAHRGNLVADEFLYYADILSSMRREEIFLVATLHKHYWENKGKQFEEELSGVTKRVEPNHIGLREIWGDAKNELIPSIFPDEPWMYATAMAVGRTGLLMTEDSIDDIGFFKPSPLLEELVGLAPIEAALKREGRSDQ